MRGVYIDVRHASGCPAKRQADERPTLAVEAQRCRCAPGVRARVAGRWVKSGKLAEGWRQADLQTFELEALQLKDDHDSGRRVLQQRRAPVFSDWGKRRIERLESLVAAGDYSPNTLATYRATFRKHLEPELGELRLTEITERHLNELRAAKLGAGLSANTVRGIFITLSAMLSDAVPEHIATNPASIRGKRRQRGGVTWEQPPQAPKHLDLDLARALLNTTGGWLHAMILCGLTTGMREREIAGLRFEHVHAGDKRILVASQVPVQAPWRERPPKYGRVREVPLYSGLARLVAQRAEHATGPYVFADEHGQPLRRAETGPAFTAAWDAIGDRPTGRSWHTLRHTFASLLDRARIRASLIDLIMGHRNPGVPDRYRHVWDEEYDRIEEILDDTWSSSRRVLGEADPETAIGR